MIKRISILVIVQVKGHVFSFKIFFISQPLTNYLITNNVRLCACIDVYVNATVF